MFLVLLAVVAVAALWLVSAYNGLVGMRRNYLPFLHFMSEIANAKPKNDARLLTARRTTEFTGRGRALRRPSIYAAYQRSGFAGIPGMEYPLREQIQ